MRAHDRFPVVDDARLIYIFHEFPFFYRDQKQKKKNDISISHHTTITCIIRWLGYENIEFRKCERREIIFANCCPFPTSHLIPCEMRYVHSSCKCTPLKLISCNEKRFFSGESNPSVCTKLENFRYFSIVSVNGYDAFCQRMVFRFSAAFFTFACTSLNGIVLVCV